MAVDFPAHISRLHSNLVDYIDRTSPLNVHILHMDCSNEVCGWTDGLVIDFRRVGPAGSWYIFSLDLLVINSVNLFVVSSAKYRMLVLLYPLHRTEKLPGNQSDVGPNRLYNQTGILFGIK